MYPVTLTLSVLAAQATETLPDLEIETRRLPGDVGDCPSTEVVGAGVAVGAAVAVGVGAGDGVGASVGVGDGLGPSVGIGEGSAVGSGDGVGASVGDGEGPSVGVAVGDEEGRTLGAGKSPTEILTRAPAGDAARVVIEVPVTGSTSVLPTASGASMFEMVAGFVSTSCDWLSDA